MSKQQEIPDEAVEAAAKVMFDQSSVPAGMVWADIRDEYCALMRPSLEAAAPFMCPPSSQVQTQAARLRATLDERLGRGTPQTKEGYHE